MVTNILYMPAGVEMDVLIAVQFFGRTPHPSKNKILGDAGRYVAPLHYSIAIMSAWRIVEKLSTKWDWRIMNNQNSSKYPGMHYGFGLQALDANSQIKTIFALGETVTLAICRAAILTNEGVR